MIKTKLLSAMAGAGDVLYSDDVFSSYLYTGSTPNFQPNQINNGIALSSSKPWQINVKGYATNQHTTHYAQAVDDADNVYVVGDGFASNNGHITKFDSSGNIVWNKYVNNGGSGNKVTAVHISNQGDLFVAGSHLYQGDNLVTMFVAKINPTDGSVIWHKGRKFNSSSSSITAWDIKTDSAGSVYVVGEAYITYTCGVIIKFDSAGVFQWHDVRAGSGGGTTAFRSMEIDGTNIFVVGTTYSNGTTQVGAIYKYTSSGTISTKIYLSNVDSSQIYGCKFNSDKQRLYFCGYFYTGGVKRGFLAYIDQNLSSLTGVRAYMVGETRAITIDSSNNIYTRSQSSTYAIYQKYDSSGNVIHEFKLHNIATGTMYPSFSDTANLFAKNGNIYSVCSGWYNSYTASAILKFDSGFVLDGSYSIYTITAANGYWTTSTIPLSIATESFQYQNIPTVTDYTYGGVTNLTFAVSDTKQFSEVQSPGGMVWIKGRDQAYDHQIFDTVRDKSVLSSNNTSAAATYASFLNYKSDGFEIYNSAGFALNYNPYTYVSWTFRKAPKFFDCGTYTGNGVAGRQITHNLGVAPGMVIVKSSTNANQWYVYHRSLGVYSGGLNGLILNGTEGTGTYAPPISAVSASTFSVEDALDSNMNGRGYVWYAFAHDPSAEGIIQCGSFTPNGGTSTINLGWEPQYLLTKATGAANNWNILDSMRGFGSAPSASTNALQPNLSSSEANLGAGTYITSTGFTDNFFGTGAGTIIYLAIRRPNKPPTTGTQVYNAIARTGTGAAAAVTGVGFAPDLALIKQRNTGNFSTAWDRLRGATKLLRPTGTSAEETFTDALTGFDSNDGVKLGTDSTALYINASGGTFINHFFKRAPGVFDVVCYTGTGSARTVNHSLGVAPELVIIKGRSTNSGGNSWAVWCQKVSTTNDNAYLNTNSAFSDFGWVTAVSSSDFSIGNSNLETINQNAATYVAYLFATKAGISKVGSYTGNGSSQTINCGFSAGARFVLIKQTDAVGYWFVFDTARGIVSGNDPYLLLNSTASEATGADIVDPTSVGFVINEAAGSLNSGGASYIYLAFA